ncbi:MAG: hypothetical protein ACREK8_03890 [Gemmatimonadales bacterium]
MIATRITSLLTAAGLLLAAGTRALGAQAFGSDTGRTLAATGCGACIGGPIVGLRPVPVSPTADTGRSRAIEYSNAYAVRLKIHQIGSYIELPLFAAEYFVGNKVLNDERADPSRRSSLKGTHSAIASGLEILFAVNTVTGGWNLIESRHDPAGRARRWIHSITMLVADGGFVATAGSAGSARGGGNSADTHRNLAIASMGLATAATLMMWLWKD